MKDGSQIRGIHQSMLVFSRDFNGEFPRPSSVMMEVARLNSIDLGDQPSDLDDHTGALYSLCVMANYFGPEILISPVEPSGLVSVMDDYNWQLYDPTRGTVWDPDFKMHVDDPKIGANASYAHLTLTCVGADTEWKETLNPDVFVLGTRGTRNGAGPGHKDHDRSITLQIHGGSDEWVGNLAANDNHVEVRRGDAAFLKSIFNRDDMWMSISTSVRKKADGFDVVDVYD